MCLRARRNLPTQTSTVRSSMVSLSLPSLPIRLVRIELVGIFDEMSQQAKFIRSQCDRIAAPAGAVGGEIQREIAVHQAGARCRRGAGGRAHLLHPVSYQFRVSGPTQ